MTENIKNTEIEETEQVTEQENPGVLKKTWAWIKGHKKGLAIGGAAVGLGALALIKIFKNNNSDDITELTEAGNDEDVDYGDDVATDNVTTEI